MAAGALIGFLAQRTLVLHNSWATEGAEVRLKSIRFLRNAGIGGGLLAVIGAGPEAFIARFQSCRRRSPPVVGGRPHSTDAEVSWRRPRSSPFMKLQLATTSAPRPTAMA